MLKLVFGELSGVFGGTNNGGADKHHQHLLFTGLNRRPKQSAQQGNIT